MVNLKEKNLLVICDGYPSKDNSIYNNIFVKNQLKYIAPHFNKVFVISPTPYFPRILKNFNFFPKRYTNSSKLENYIEKNIEVYFPRFFTLPISSYYQKKKNELFQNACLKLIEKKYLIFNIIHAHFTKPAGVVANRLKHKFHTPYILTVHEGHKWLEKEINSNDPNLISSWENANTIIRVNKQDCFKLKKYKNCTVSLQNGFDSEIFKYENINVNKNKNRIVFVGNLVIREKNQINLINAINLIIKKYPDLRLNIIGDGPDKNKIQQEINRLKLNNYVKLLGSKKPTEIKSILKKSKLLVLPSYEESFGIVQIEAMACGVPVVATINGGSEEIIISKDLGILVKNSEDQKELAEAIDVAINKKWNSKQIADYVKKTYSWKKIAQEIILIYKNTIK